MEKAKARTKKRQNNEFDYLNQRAEEQAKTRANKISKETGRGKSFRDSIKDGRIYECVCCHRVWFKNSVKPFTPEYEAKLEDDNKGIINCSIGRKQTAKTNEQYQICTTCINYVSKGKVPPMSNQNNLQLMDLSNFEELHLTELENSMIALNIIFQKIFKLPKSRWPAMKDKTVNIPIFQTDILKTIESLPRTPSAARIIPINFKRKMNFKNNHMTQYISVPKILKALETLKIMGNPYYQFIPVSEHFEDECKENDLEGFQFIYPEDEIMEEKIDDRSNEVDVTEETEGTEETKEAKDTEDTEAILEKEEEDYQKNDPVKKWQFEYNRSTCFNNDYPEISYKEDSGDRLSIAPGEGKHPSNILQERDWDLKSFPTLLPDGKNSLHSDREVKLSEQDYFSQRIMNKDPRFACNPAYVFAAIAYIEKKQIEGRRGISYMRGKSTTLLDGTKSYSLDDPYSVLDNVKNTPRYWQRTRYELMARLENLGAFTFFFTLSCADMRWPENFTALLRDQIITYEEVDFREEVFVRVGNKKEALMDYLSRNASKHEFIRKNLLNATLTFHQRVKMFVKHIIMSKGNPMCIKYNSYKVEFALRGAGHIHGVLWIDWESFSFPRESQDQRYRDCADETTNESSLDDKKEKDKKDGKKYKKHTLIDAFEKIRNEETLEPNEKEIIAQFADLFITCSLKDPRTRKIVEEVQIHHHTKACRKYCPICRFFFPRFPSLNTIVSVPFHKLPGSREEQLEKLEKSKAVLKKVSNVLENEETMDELIQIDMREIEDYIDIKYTILALEDFIKKKNHENIKVRVLMNIKKYTAFQDGNMTLSEENLDSILEELNDTLKSIKIEEVEKRRLERLLDKAGIETEEGKSVLEIYADALGVSKTGYKIIHKRDIDECYVNNYNAEWILNWNANMDLQLCLDYYAVITYISDYYSKDDSGTMGHIKEALKKAGNESLQAKLSLVIHQFLTHRQIGESEAFFKIFPHLHMKSSNIETVFLPNGFKVNRSGFLKELTKEEAKHCKHVIKVENKEGFFTEKPSMIDKFERKDLSRNKYIRELSYTQFGMKYVSSNAKPKLDCDFESTVIREGLSGWNITDEMNLIVTHDFEVRKERYTLPNFIELKDRRPGEPMYMRKRTRQVIRFHKINSTKHPHEYKYSQLQMYSPFNKEENLEPDNFENCESLFNQKSEHNNLLKVENVKSILMKHLEAVEEGTVRAHDTMNAAVGDMIDPALAQENEDCEDEGVADHPDFLFKDPSDLKDSEHEKRKFKSIELYDDQILESMTRSLDEDQRTVLEIGVNFAMSIVKAKHCQDTRVTPELLVVQGGAGTGKSTVIDVLSQQMEKIFRSPGDNPDHPYIVKAAFTGTAAANIKGQTLHSAFSFSFGNEFFSLSDKVRDERRNQLENLLVVIIDEFSFIKADMLYLLDMRLREVKQVPDVAFGGISVFLFGDILQLRPVLARYIFEDPTSERFKLAFLICSLWNMFQVVILRTNHRQGEDKVYADILNRIRTGEFSEDDVKTLETRVRPLNHSEIPLNALVVTCTNKEVNRINEERLMTIEQKEYVYESINRRSTQKQFKPRTDASGAISGTPLQKTLRLKVGAKVMLTYNIDTCDCLTNGAFGEVVDFSFSKDGKLKEVYVHFFNDDCGREMRKNFVEVQTKFPGKNVLPIKLIQFQYSLSKKNAGGSSNATVIQFPLRLAFASTAHKVQGLTVKKPNNLVVDLRTVREAAQAYVILSRVQALSQLFILESVSADRITASMVAMEELERMQRDAINVRQKPKTSIISCNIRSMRKNFDNLVSATVTKRANVMCLQETWLDPLAPECNHLLVPTGWEQHNNSVGKGKGIATFYTENYKWVEDITEPLYQFTKLGSEQLDIINVYRSEGAETKNFLKDLFGLICSKKQTLIVGDFNLCYLSAISHQLFQAFHSKGYQQLVKVPTSSKGRLIDLAFISPSESDVYYEVRQQSQFFTDHDLIEVIEGKTIHSVSMM